MFRLFSPPQQTLKPAAPAEKIAWMRLARSDGIGPVTLGRLKGRFGSALKALDHIQNSPKFKNLSIVPQSVIEDEIASVTRLGGMILCSYEDGYPAALAAIADPPPVLTVLGDAVCLQMNCIGIVGTRNASLNGRRMAALLASGLGKAGYAVVSGMARGIDTAAHEAALKDNAATIAVLAGGADQIYPRENDKLYRAILAAGDGGKGAIISESPLGMQPNARLFPRRNRIVSGLSLGLVVVEAALRSGSLITARQALDQGREVFAVPGFPLDPRAEGPNSLIKQGARLATSVADVTEELAGMTWRPRPPDLFCGLSGAAQSLVPVAGDEDDLLDEALAEALQLDGRYAPTAPAYDAPDDVPQTTRAYAGPEETVLSALGAAPVGVDEVIRACGLGAGEVQTILMTLELSGKIERLPGNRVALLGDVA